MAKTAAKQPIGSPEPDAHISMYEQSKWPLTKRDQTYLSQANKFWNFISTDVFLVGMLPNVSLQQLHVCFAHGSIAVTCPAFATFEVLTTSHLCAVLL